MRFLLPALFASSLVVSSQPPPPIETPQLTVVVSNPAGPVAPGARVTLRLDVTPKPKMHVYAPGQKDYIPVSLQLDSSAAYTARPPVFPAGEKFFFEPLNETQLVYSKPFRITQTVTIARTPAVRQLASAADAALPISGALRYQACDDVVCYPPKTVRVTWTIAIR